MSMLNQLFEAVYYGVDLEFKYNDNYYFVNSGSVSCDNVSKHSIVVSRSKNSFYEGDNNDDCEEIYSSTQSDANENTNKLFEAKIFDGKPFYAIVDSITNISY